MAAALTVPPPSDAAIRPPRDFHDNDPRPTPRAEITGLLVTNARPEAKAPSDALIKNGQIAIAPSSNRMCISTRSSAACRTDDKLIECLGTRRGAKLRSHDPATGCESSLVLTAGDNLAQIAVDRPKRALLVKSGRIVARDGKWVD